MDNGTRLPQGLLPGNPNDGPLEYLHRMMLQAQSPPDYRGPREPVFPVRSPAQSGPQRPGPNNLPQLPGPNNLPQLPGPPTPERTGAPPRPSQDGGYQRRDNPYGSDEEQFRALAQHMFRQAPRSFEDMQTAIARLDELLSRERDTAGEYRRRRDEIDAQRPERFDTLDENQRYRLNQDFFDALIAGSSRMGSSFGTALGDALQVRGDRRREMTDRNESRWEQNRARQMQDLMAELGFENSDDEAAIRRNEARLRMIQGMYGLHHQAGQSLAQLSQQHEQREDQREQHAERRADQFALNARPQMVEILDERTGRPVRVMMEYRVDPVTREGQWTAQRNDDGTLATLPMPNNGDPVAARQAAERERTMNELYSTMRAIFPVTGPDGLSNEEVMNYVQMEMSDSDILRGLITEASEGMDPAAREAARQDILRAARTRRTPYRPTSSGNQ